MAPRMGAAPVTMSAPAPAVAAAATIPFLRAVSLSFSASDDAIAAPPPIKVRTFACLRNEHGERSGPMSSAPDRSENTPLVGEHVPGSSGPHLTRLHIFGPLAVGLAVAGAMYGWSLRTPRTIAGLRAGGQAIGDVP